MSCSRPCYHHVHSSTNITNNEKLILPQTIQYSTAIAAKGVECFAVVAKYQSPPSPQPPLHQTWLISPFPRHSTSLQLPLPQIQYPSPITPYTLYSIRYPII